MAIIFLSDINFDNFLIVEDSTIIFYHINYFTNFDYNFSVTSDDLLLTKLVFSALILHDLP
jgi:hypothetical protein